MCLALWPGESGVNTPGRAAVRAMTHAIGTGEALGYGDRPTHAYGDRPTHAYGEQRPFGDGTVGPGG